MSLTAFDTLLRKHPGEETYLATVEEAVVTMVRKNPGTAIDEERLEAMTNLNLALLELYLAELVAAGALEPRFALQCAMGKGPSAEAPALSALPEIVECDRCGGEHAYDRSRVTVFFVPTDSLIHSVLA